MPKTKKGEQISWSEWFTRAGEGIKNVAQNPTPLEKITIEKRGTGITLVGLIVSLIAIFIFRNDFVTVWLSYGLILVFLGSVITVGLKYLGLKQQKKFLQDLEVKND